MQFHLRIVSAVSIVTSSWIKQGMSECALMKSSSEMKKKILSTMTVVHSQKENVVMAVEIG